jgi:hypothetical protein
MNGGAGEPPPEDLAWILSVICSPIILRILDNNIVI